MKKVGKYLVITLLLLLGLCCVGVLYLFFIPNSNLFNITYINHNKLIKSDIYSTEDVEHIVINSRAYDIEIVTAKEDEIRLEVFSNSFGFVLTKNENPNLTTSIKNKILTFDVKEPYGAAINNNSYVKLFLSPEDAVDLTINNKSASTKINSENLIINNLTYSTISGNFDFKSGSITGDMNLDINRSTFKIYENVTTNKNNLKLKVSSGKLYAEKEELGNVEVLENNRGVISLMNCSRFTEKVKSAGDQIYLNKASYVNILTSDTNVTVNEVTDGADIELTGSGKVNVTTLKAISIIKTNSGNISVTNAESNLTVHSNSGNIKVDSANTLVSTKTKSGNINITFNENAKSYKDSTASTIYRMLIAKIEDGQLTATGVEHIGVTSDSEGIEITGKGKVKLAMHNVYGSNEIVGNNGNINAIINKDSVYTLTTISETGSVRVNLTQIIQYGGYTLKESTQTNVNCKEVANDTLVISTTKGNLSVLDTNFA